MPIRKFENDEEEMMEYARMYVDGMAARQRYDPAKAKAYYQRNREAILEMNKRYYAHHRAEYVDYLRAYWSENREVLAQRYKLHKLVKKRAKENDTRREWAIERETFVNSVIPDTETVPPAPLPPRRRRKQKEENTIVKPYTFTIKTPTEPMTFD